jgi:ATP-dependent RNA helicase DHX8/PRP22
VGPPSQAVCELVRRALTVGFANRLARRMRLHNGYRTCNEKGALAQIHPSSSQLSCDDDGLLPEWLIYNEFVATSRPFLRQVRGCGGVANPVGGGRGVWATISKWYTP